ncbi:MAG: DUF3365 domain-containing protein [Gemmatimonadota bacterium]|nr:DUF3365 domain-containing protein [Gemmatimonadota bacterium]
MYPTRAGLRTGLVLLAAVAVPLGCVGSDAPSSARLTPEAEAAAVSLGGEAAAELSSTLVQRLRAAIEEDGAAGAVGFCSEEGLALTAAVGEAVGAGIGRTSSRIRNPANAPDSLARVALAYFEETAASGEALPPSLVQRTPSGDFRYYQPLLIQPFCLQCHGRASDLGEGVAAGLAERYPDDRATDYRAGDFRGLIHVTLPQRGVDAAIRGGRP